MKTEDVGEQLKKLAFAISNAIRYMEIEKYSVYIHTSRYVADEISRIVLAKEKVISCSNPASLISWLKIEKTFDVFKLKVCSDCLGLDKEFEADSVKEATANLSEIISIVNGLASNKETWETLWQTRREREQAMGRR